MSIESRIKELIAKEYKNTILKASKVKYDDDDVPDLVKKAFKKTADTQRDKPEIHMVDLQILMGGGVMNLCVEHIGDLSHRVASVYKLPDWAAESTKEKIEKCLRTLTNSYGFDREFEENILNNWNYIKDKNSNKFKNFEEYNSAVINGLNKYSKLHQTVPVWNQVQWLSRQAAIDLGKRNTSKVIYSLKKLQRLTDNYKNFIKNAGDYEIDEQGRPIPYRQ